jgi:hypothetical protein
MSDIGQLEADAARLYNQHSLKPSANALSASLEAQEPFPFFGFFS